MLESKKSQSFLVASVLGQDFEPGYGITGEMQLDQQNKKNQVYAGDQREREKNNYYLFGEIY